MRPSIKEGRGVRGTGGVEKRITEKERKFTYFCCRPFSFPRVPFA